MSLDHRTAALSRLRQAYAKKKDAETEQVQSVVDARAVGATWQRIADELEILQPNAVRKYKPRLASVEPRTLWEGEADPVTPALVAVRHARQALIDAEAAELQAVADARQVEVRWEDIAEVVEMQEPNAVAKYKPKLVVVVERKVSVRSD